jgi:hypothetical protein
MHIKLILVLGNLELLTSIRFFKVSINTFNPLARFIALRGLRTRKTRRILTVEILSELIEKRDDNVKKNHQSQNLPRKN